MISSALRMRSVAQKVLGSLRLPNVQSTKNFGRTRNDRILERPPSSFPRLPTFIPNRSLVTYRRPTRYAGTASYYQLVALYIPGSLVIAYNMFLLLTEPSGSSRGLANRPERYVRGKLNTYCCKDEEPKPTCNNNNNNNNHNNNNNNNHNNNNNNNECSK